MKGTKTVATRAEKARPADTQMDTDNDSSASTPTTSVTASITSSTASSPLADLTDLLNTLNTNIREMSTNIKDMTSSIADLPNQLLDTIQPRLDNITNRLQKLSPPPPRDHNQDADDSSSDTSETQHATLPQSSINTFSTGLHSFNNTSSLRLQSSTNVFSGTSLISTSLSPTAALPVMLHLYLYSSTHKKLRLLESSTQLDIFSYTPTLSLDPDSFEDIIRESLEHQFDNLPSTLNIHPFYAATHPFTSTYTLSTDSTAPTSDYSLLGFAIELTDEFTSATDHSTQDIKLDDLKSLCANKSSRLLNGDITLLDYFSDNIRSINAALAHPSSRTPAARNPSLNNITSHTTSTTGKSAKQRLDSHTKSIKGHPPGNLFQLQLETTCAIRSLQHLVPSLTHNPYSPAPPWTKPPLKDTRIAAIYQFFYDAHTYCQRNQRPLPWDAISPNVKQHIVSHSTNHKHTPRPLLIGDILAPGNTAIFIRILTDMAKPVSTLTFLQAFNDSVHFPNPTVHNPLTDIIDLINSLDIFMSNVFTFYTQFYNSATLSLPMTDKPSGFLYALFRKMPRMLVLLTFHQHQINKAVTPLSLLDVLYHIDNVVTAHLKEPHRSATAFHAALPTPSFTSQPLLTRYPLYTGSTNPDVSHPTLPRRLDNTPPTDLHRRSDPPHYPDANKRSDTNHQSDPYRRPDFPKQSPYTRQPPGPNPQQQQHLSHYPPAADPPYYSDQDEDYDSNAHLHLHPSHLPPDHFHPSDPDYSDDESIHSYHPPPQPEPLHVLFPHDIPDMKTLHYDRYVHHLQFVTQSKDPRAACYRKLWTGQCNKPGCKWEHNTTALEHSWHFHHDLLSNSRYNPSSKSPPHHQPTQVLTRPTQHQPRHPPPRHPPDQHRLSTWQSDPQHSSRNPYHR